MSRGALPADTPGPRVWRTLGTAGLIDQALRGLGSACLHYSDGRLALLDPEVRLV